MHQEWLGHDIAQKAEARDDRAEGGTLGHDVQELDFQHVAGLGALHEDGPGQGMHGTRVDCREAGDRRGGRDLAVERVAAFQDDFLVDAGL